MKKLILIIVLLIRNVALGYAQEKGHAILPPDSISINDQKEPDDILQFAIIKTIGKHLDLKLLLETPEHHSHIMSIAVVINKEGKIDKVYFSEKMSPDFKKIIKPDAELIHKLRDIPLKFPKYKEKIVILPILFKRMQDASLDYESSFLNDFENIWPSFDVKDKNKQIVLLRPYINIFSLQYK